MVRLDHTNSNHIMTCFGGQRTSAVDSEECYDCRNEHGLVFCCGTLIFGPSPISYVPTSVVVGSSSPVVRRSQGCIAYNFISVPLFDAGEGYLPELVNDAQV